MGTILRKPRRRTTDTFTDWLDETGLDRVAKALRVTPMAVRYWRDYHGAMRAGHMRQIRKMSGGRVTYEAMIDRTSEPRRRR